MHEHTVLAIAGIGVAALFCQWLAWRMKLPAILFLLIAGIAVGPLFDLLNPELLFGDLLFPFISLAVSIILFEGSLTLRFDEIKGLEKIVRRMVSSGLLVTGAVTTVAVHYLVGFEWELALLFGALTTVTGPTVIVPMLRTVRPTSHLSNILRWEGIVIDPIGALLAVLVFEFIVSGQSGDALGHTLYIFAKSIGTGLLFGAVAGYALGLLLRHYLLPEYLHAIATLTLVFAIFALSNEVQEESGLLSVTVMGIWLANMRGVEIESILDFKEHLSLILISGLFIILAARIDPQSLIDLGLPALGVLLAMQFIARPLKIMVATWGSGLSLPEKALLAWIAPRGIVAAAVSALFAIRLGELGYEQAPLLVTMTFFVIIGTVVLQSATARPLAVWLGVAEPEPSGFLIVGANPLARTIAKALDEQGIPIMLADSRWGNLRSAHMAGLRTFYGEATSPYADRKLDLVGLGNLLALSPYDETNALAALRYRSEFGAGQIFVLPSGEEEQERKEEAGHHSGRLVFAEGSNHRNLSEMLANGARIHTTHLSEEFDINDYYLKYSDHAVPLFAINTRGRLRPFTYETPPDPGADWYIIALIDEEESAARDGDT